MCWFLRLLNIADLKSKMTDVGECIHPQKNDQDEKGKCI